MLSPAVSIIIPCYNAEKYLDMCIGSLRSQTMQNIEIICVDDGSTDHTLDLLNRYAAEDPRVRVFTQRNQYAGAARNLGLSHARGEYVVFLDSDDFFAETLAEDAYNAAISNTADVVIYDAQYFDEAIGASRKGWFLKTAYIPEKQPFSFQDCPDTLYQITNPAPWTKLFRRQFLLDTKLQFQPLQNTNDSFFILSALAMAKRIVTLDKVLVNYRVGQGTNLQSNKAKNPLCFYTAYKAWHDKLVETGLFPILQRSYVNKALAGCLYNLTTQKDLEAKKIVFDMLRNEILQELEITGHDESYYLLKNEHNEQNAYNELLTILHGTFETYLEIPTSPFQLKKLWNVLETETRNLRSLSRSPQQYKTAVCTAVNRIRYHLKQNTQDFAHPNARQAYQMVHKAFQQEAFSGIHPKTFPNISLYQGFIAIRNHDYPAMQEMLSRRLIVSLTTYPGRIGTLTQVLDTLYKQDKPADEILLWLAEEQFPGKEKDLPEDLMQLVGEGRLTIRWCDDLKPHKKYFYALQEYPEDLIVTVDDDLLYSKNMLSSLYASYLMYPNAVSAVRVHLMLISEDNKLLPYNTWIRETDCCLYTPSMQLFATGGAGTLYPPHLFRQEFFDQKAIAENCLLADDLWLKAMELLSGVPVVAARPREALKYLPWSQKDGLKQINDVRQHNDVQLANILRWTDKKFGPDAMLSILTDASLYHPILTMESVTYHMDQERRAIRDKLNATQSSESSTKATLQQTQKSLAQKEAKLKETEAKLKEAEAKLKSVEAQRKAAETKCKETEAKLRTTTVKLRRAEEAQSLNRQMKDLGAMLRGLREKGHSPLSVGFKLLIYYIAWIPEKILVFLMYYLRNGFTQTVKHALRKLSRRG